MTSGTGVQMSAPHAGGQALGDGTPVAPGRPGTPVLALLALAVVVVAAAAAYGVANLVEARYGARTDLLYEVGGADSEPRAERLLATQVEVLRSRGVLGPVAAAHGLRPQALAERVDADLLDGSQVIRLTVTDTDPERALALVADVVERYAGLVDPDADAATGGQGDVDGIAGPAARVLSPPYLLDEPVWPRPLQAVAAGVLVGLVLAAGLLLVAYRRGLTARP